MTIHQLLEEARTMGASDVHLTKGLPPMLRVNGQLAPYGSDSDYAAIGRLIDELTDNEQKLQLQEREQQKNCNCMAFSQIWFRRCMMRHTLASASGKIVKMVTIF